MGNTKKYPKKQAQIRKIKLHTPCGWDRKKACMAVLRKMKDAKV